MSNSPKAPGWTSTAGTSLAKFVGPAVTALGLHLGGSMGLGLGGSVGLGASSNGVLHLGSSIGLWPGMRVDSGACDSMELWLDNRCSQGCAAA